LFIDSRFIDNESQTEIRIINMESKTVYTQNIYQSENPVSIHFENCISGIYIISLYVNNECVCSKEITIKK